MLYYLPTRCGNAIYSNLGPRYLKLLKWQRHKESVSCKEQEPISLNHVGRVKKEWGRKESEKKLKKSHLKLLNSEDYKLL